MKQFLYLDTDIVNSIVAQSQKGLVTQTIVEKEDNTTKNSGNTENISAAVSGNYDEEGNYVEIKRYYDFVDLDYLEGLFTQGGLIDFIKKNK